MTNKKHTHLVLSNSNCKKCGRRLKQNLVDKNPDAKLCYKCHKNS